MISTNTKNKVSEFKILFKLDKSERMFLLPFLGFFYYLLLDLVILFFFYLNVSNFNQNLGP